jgi:hypothetical protein
MRDRAHHQGDQADPVARASDGYLVAYDAGGAAPLGTGINPRLMLNATIAGVPGSWAAAAS